MIKKMLACLFIVISCLIIGCSSDDEEAKREINQQGGTEQSDTSSEQSNTSSEQDREADENTEENAPENTTATTTTTTTTNSITQFGITWTFDKAYPYGNFANGDYWVEGPLTIINIEPASVTIDGRTINGSMINPKPSEGEVQGYDSAMYGNATQKYDAALNVGRPDGEALSSDNPLNIQQAVSLVSSISLEEAGARPQLRSAAILTVVDEAPANGRFRPPYAGDDKHSVFGREDLDFSHLARLQAVDSAPSFESVEANFERVWLDHVTNYAGRFIHPTENMPDYGREIADQTGVAALMLHLDVENDIKETLLTRYVQLGIDLQGLVDNGGNWMNNGGHASGRKWPILFAGIMLNDERMKSIGAKSGIYLYSGDFGPGNMPPDYVQFGEDQQTFYITQEDVDRTNSEQWNPDFRSGTPMPYPQEHIGLPEWGKRHATDPYRDNYDWLVTYRNVAGSGWNGYVLAARIMEDRSDAMTLWNHPALFDYMDRYMATEEGVFRSTSQFTEQMWDRYRLDYGAIWSGN